MIRIGLLVLLLFLGGCNQAEQDSILRFGLQSAPITLDPRYATDAASTRIVRLLYQSLIDFNEQSKPIASLADWQQLSPTQYRFRIQPGHKFTTGREVSAEDVRQTYLSLLYDKPASPFRSQLQHIRKIQVIDNSNIDFILSRPDNLFVSRMNLGILPADLLRAKHDFATTPVGSGDFKYLSWRDQKTLILLRRSDNKQISFIEVKDPTVRVLKLLKGEIDIIQNDITPELIAFLDNKKSIDVQTAGGSNFTYVGFNLADQITGDVKIREALAYAIDRPAIIKHVLSGYARPAASILVPEHWAGHQGISQKEYQPEKARKILHALGYDEQHPLKLSYKTSANPLRVRLATIIQHQLAIVGVELAIKSHDWGTFYGDIKAGNFQMYSLSWVGIHSPDIFENVFHSASVPPQGANRGKYQNQHVDQWIQASQQATDLNSQVMYYRKIQETVLNDLPYIPMWYENHVVARRQYVHGYRLKNDGSYDSLQTVTWKR